MRRCSRNQRGPSSSALAPLDRLGMIHEPPFREDPEYRQQPTHVVFTAVVSFIQVGLNGLIMQYFFHHVAECGIQGLGGGRSHVER